MERKLRFKTEEEMIRDYGPYWMENMPSPKFNNLGKMNYLLGKELSPEEEEQVKLARDIITVHTKHSRWIVGKEQIVEGEEKEYTIKPGGLFQTT